VGEGTDPTGRRGEEMGKGCKWVNKYCVHMYINGKKIPVDTIPGM
jgi:hypothetical protein